MSGSRNVDLESALDGEFGSWEILSQDSDEEGRELAEIETRGARRHLVRLELDGTLTILE